MLSLLHMTDPIENPPRKVENKEGMMDGVPGQRTTSVQFPKIEKYEIDPKTQKDIENLTAEAKFRAGENGDTNEKIGEIVYERNNIVEKMVDDEQTPVVKMETRPRNRVRNAFMALAALFTMGASHSAKAENGNFNDSTKIKKEKTVSIKSDSLETEYTGNEAVDDVLREDWNEFQSWLASKNLAGKPELDKGGLGYKIFDEYCKTHETSLNRAKLALIREEFKKLRAKIILEVNTGKSSFAPGANEKNLLKPVIDNEGTGDPNYPGYNFTKFRFPSSTTVTYDQSAINHNKIANDAINSKLQGRITNVMSNDSKLVKVENEGFVKSKEVIKDRNPIANSDFVKSNNKFKKNK